VPAPGHALPEGFSPAARDINGRLYPVPADPPELTQSSQRPGAGHWTTVSARVEFTPEKPPMGGSVPAHPRFPEIVWPTEAAS